ncbi:hypothetical protein D3C81_2220130 [compost metagenome]
MGRRLQVRADQRILQVLGGPLDEQVDDPFAGGRYPVQRRFADAGAARQLLQVRPGLL